MYKEEGVSFILHMQANYDYSYHSIASFIGGHLVYHFKRLK